MNGFNLQDSAQKLGASDFDELTPEQCVFNDTNDEETMRICRIWTPIGELDSCLASAKQAELFANGIVKKITAPKYDMCLAVDIDSVDEFEDFQRSAFLSISAVLNAYGEWKNKRERLLTGREGAFFEFGDIAQVIADLCTLRGITTYEGLNKIIIKLLDSWTIDNNTLEEEVDTLEHMALTANTTESQTLMMSAKHMAFINLRRSRLFSAANLALVHYKLKDMCAVEKKINNLRKKYLKNENQGK